jgi:hypothetical protein
VCATISDKTNRYETLDEMKEYVGSKIHDLDIQGYEPGLHFLLNQTETIPSNPTSKIAFHELRTEQITDDADALFYRVNEFLQSHQQKPVRMPFIYIAIVAFAWCVILSLNNTAVVNGQLAIHASVPWFTSFIIMIGSLVWAGYIRNYVSLETKANSPSFFARNRDELVRQAIIAVFSLVVGVIVGLVLAHFQAKH